MRITVLLCALQIAFVSGVPAAFFTTFQENTVNNETETISEGDEAAPCLVSDILYNHGQQIERQNECDYCLCVDGDMFCYWQCATKQPPSTNSQSTSDTTTAVQVADVENFTSAQLDKLTQNNTAVTTEPEISSSKDGSNVTGTAQNNSTTKPNNQTCIVTGTEYSEGDILPQEEGSCLQCVCGADGRVTCSPQDCVSLQQDAFRHGLDSNSLDMFDVDVF
ncbi:uncharacterized protein LOC135845430 isoform X2 [Planococcus citri]|uniref:uncharacterized protein LOC135845430 isoform X2 n=1 Tax=Planococcus citri TaxID=170843 RepID=UPI0031F81B11